MEINFEMPDWIYDLLTFDNINKDMKIIKKSKKMLAHFGVEKLSAKSKKKEFKLEGERRDPTLAESCQTFTNMPKDYLGKLLDIFPIDPEWTRKKNN